MSERNYDEHGMDVGRRFGGKLTEKEKRDREVEMRGWTPAVDWKVRALTAESALQVARDALREATGLLVEMQAIHAMAYHANVTDEAYPGERHEDAEEGWLRRVTEWLTALAPEVSP